MTDTLVSIIVPVYNAGSYLSPCVESLTSQTYRNIERILVDDGSTDGSGKVLDAYAAKDAGIRVIHKKNGGLVSAWKRGAAEASGRYVMFVDSDDWIDPDFAERLMAQATGRDDEIISAGYVIERENGKKQEVQSSALPGIYEGEKLMELQNELLGHESRRVILSRCMKLISRKLLLANETYTDESVRMGEDLTVMLPCLYTCGRLVLVDGCFGYHYRFVDTSMVHRYNPYLYGNIRKLGEILTRIAEDFDIPDGKTKAELVKIWSDAFFVVGGLTLCLGILMWVAGEGTFDLFTYAFSMIFRLRFFRTKASTGMGSSSALFRMPVMVS